MRDVLVVSPIFPPSNAADMHRVRASLPHFAGCGWQARVLAIRPEALEVSDTEELLNQVVPPETEVRRVGAMPVRFTRRWGLGAPGLRALPQLLQAGSRWIRERRPDLVYFSTTQFPVMVLGSYWRRRFGVPFVVDIQDPWITGVRTVCPDQVAPLKHRVMRFLHRRMEPRVMAATSGLVSVSEQFVRALQDRYPRLAHRPSRIVRFSVAESDFGLLARHPQHNPFFVRGDGCWHGAYVGRGGHNIEPSLHIFFRAWRRGLTEEPALFERVRLHFIGTDYAPVGREKKTVEPIARQYGLEAWVQEVPLRQPYFTALQVLHDAHFIAVPGSMEPEYAASKLCACILARRPVVATFHEQSSAVGLLRGTRAGDVVAFGDPPDTDRLAGELRVVWGRWLKRLPAEPPTDWAAFEPFSARSTTAQQCALFDEVLGEHTRHG